MRNELLLTNIVLILLNIDPIPIINNLNGLGAGKKSTNDCVSNKCEIFNDFY